MLLRLRECVHALLCHRYSIRAMALDECHCGASDVTGAGVEAYEDKNIEILSGVIGQAIEQYGLTFPRGGYLLKRGRGRVIVEPAAEG